MAITEEQFQSAVKVIRSLPKSGPFQPTDDLRLQFYGLYKQATEGPNTSKKPAFYDLVGKAKWEAWSKVSELPKEEAMDRYVQIFIQVLRTMALTEADKEFFEILMPFRQYLPESSQQIMAKVWVEVTMRVINFI